MNNIKLAGMLAMAVIFTANLPAGFAQQKTIAVDKTEAARLRAVIEANPDDLKAHEAYIKALVVLNPELIAQYEIWLKKYPKSAIVPFAIGDGFTNHEDPRAKPYLLKAVAIDPKFAVAWAALAVDAECWGDLQGSRQYIAKAVEIAPDNSDYLFRYALSYMSADPKKFKEISLKVLERFPESQRSAQALYWLASKSNDIVDKVKYYESMRKSYPAKKYNWSTVGMLEYFNVLLISDSEKAVGLATEMAADQERGKEWEGLLARAKSIVTAKKLMDQKKGAEALTVLNQVKLKRFDDFSKEMQYLKARANHIAGNTTAAYDSLMVTFAKAPDARLKKQLATYGMELGKKELDLDADIWNQLHVKAQVATPFALKNYFTGAPTSLSDHKGKVVLLTYWFPGCGPCRAEFPHFENVVRKFNGQDLAYLGININSAQNDYIIPFVKGAGYSFTPLEDVKGRNKGNIDNLGRAPMNFLIDKEGRLVFSSFRTEANNEDELELMINLLLNKK